MTWDGTAPGKGFKAASELAAPLAQGGPTAWDAVVGDPGNDIKPFDPLMIEAFEVRPDYQSSTAKSASPMLSGEAPRLDGSPSPSWPASLPPQHLMVSSPPSSAHVWA